MAISDLFKRLPPFKFGDMSFPISEMKLSLTHAIAEHKYWATDGANLEATGREALVIEAKIPFRNTIAAGPTEKWTHTPLYPLGLRHFLELAADRKTKPLQHPELGLFQAKLKTCHVMWSGAKQDGVDADVTFFEHTEADVELYSPPAADGVVAMVDLDNAMSNAELKKLAPKLPHYPPDFASTMRGIQALADSVTLLEKRVEGKIENLAYRVNNIADAMESARNALTWPVDRACMRAADSLIRLKKELGATGRVLVVYVAPVTATLASFCPATGTSVDELLKLNPHLARDGVVRAGRVIKYFGEKTT